MVLIVGCRMVLRHVFLDKRQYIVFRVFVRLLALQYFEGE